MKILVLTNSQPCQAALCHKLAQVAQISGIVISNNRPRKPPRRRFQILLNRVVARALFPQFARTWFELQARYSGSCDGLPPVPVIKVENVNDGDTLLAMERTDPDLVVVSGTNIIGSAIIEKASRRLGIVNLHTGLSPYIKGGPNCTNWCLAENAFHLIGNTVMWLDRGIDTGAVIATEQTPLSGSETLSDLHWKVMNHAHDLYVRSIACIAAGRTVARIPQAGIAEGTTYYTADWGFLAMMRATINFCRRYRPASFQSAEFRERTRQLRLISLPPSV